MCEPVTIVSLVAMGLSTAIAAKSAHEQGKFAQSQAKAQAKMNTALAKDAVARGEAEAAAARAQTRRLLGEQKAAYAASGIDLGGGSVTDALSGTAWLGETDVMRIRHNAALEAWGYKAQSQQALAQAAADKSASRTAMYSTILGGAAKMAGGIYDAKSKGVFGSSGMSLSGAKTAASSNLAGIKPLPITRRYY